MSLCKIIFRCDGGSVSEIGTGHVQRCVLIANALLEWPGFNRENVAFVTRRYGCFSLGYQIIRNSSFKVINAKDSSLNPGTPEEVSVLVNNCSSMVIVDRLDTELEFISAIQSFGKKVVTFDDKGPGARIADGVINAIVKSPKNVKNLYSGYEYLVLESSQNQCTEEQTLNLFSVSTKQKPFTIFFSFGGYDHRNHLFRSLCLIEKHLDNVLAGMRFILVGDTSKELLPLFNEKIFKIKDSGISELLYFRRSESFLCLLNSSNIAVVNGGLTIFNALSLGLPSIGLPQYKHQLDTLLSLSSQGMAKLVSKKMSFTDKQFEDCLINLVKDVGSQALMRSELLSKFDRNGVHRVARIISNLEQTD